MELLTAIAVLLSFVTSQANMEDASALSYWNQKLPTTQIPTNILALVSSQETQDFLSFKDIQDDGVSLSVGKAPRKFGKHFPKSSSPRQPNPLFFRNYTRPSLRQPNFFFFYSYYTRPSLRQLPNYFFYSYSTALKGQPVDTAVNIFFLEKNLHSGTKVTMDLAFMTNPETLYLLPRSVANEIPFSTDKLSGSLDKLHISPDSDMALTMKKTLEECEAYGIRGESRQCVTSLESMIDYATSQLGTNDVNVFVTNVPKTSTSLGKRQYSITSIPFQSKSSSGHVVCHSISYAYAVNICHQIKDTKMFQLFMKDDEGNNAEVVAVCHHDTSAWDPDHISFKLLNVKPGGEAICHYMPDDQIVWLAAN